MNKVIKKPTEYTAARVESLDLNDPAIKILRKFGGIDIAERETYKFLGREEATEAHFEFIMEEYSNATIRSFVDHNHGGKLKKGSETWIDLGDWVVTTGGSHPTIEIHTPESYQRTFAPAEDDA